MAGREASGQAREAIRQQNYEQVVRQTLASVDFANPESVAMAQEDLLRLAAAGYRPAGEAFGLLDRQAGRIFKMQQDEAKRQADLELEAMRQAFEIANRPPDLVQLTEGNRIVFRDRQTGIEVWSVEVPPEAETTSPQNAVLAASIIEDLSALRMREEPPSYLDYIRYSYGLLRGTVAPEEQQYLSAVERVSANIVRLMSGAQASEAEVKRVKNNFLPAPGDDASTTKIKLQKLQVLAETLMQGGSLSQAVSTAEGMPRPGVPANRDGAGAASRGSIFDRYSEEGN